MNCWFSEKRKESFWCWRVSVSSARMMFARTLYVLSSVMSPDGISMLTTFDGEALMYFTSEAKPPASGLFSPEPKRPSTTSVFSSSCGGSNSCVTSMSDFDRFSSSRFLLAEQSSERWPVMLNR